MPPPELLDELVEEVLLRFPPDDPAALVRAALVCKRWRELVCDPGFRRRFRQFHRSPPILGLLCSFLDERSDSAVRFVRTTSFRRPHVNGRCVRAVDSRHGRVLLDVDDTALVVWDPVSDERRTLPAPPRRLRRLQSWGWNAAVLCAAHHGACDHLDCNRGSFLVVLVSSVPWETFILAYSSDEDAWSQRVTAQQSDRFRFEQSPLLGNSLYFNCHSDRILRYNVVRRQITVVQLPPQVSRPAQILLMATNDARLGFTTQNMSTLRLWSLEIGPHGDTRWAQRRHIDLSRLHLNRLLPADAIFTFPYVVGFVGEVELIFIWTHAAVFVVHLKSGLVKKVIPGCDFNNIVPFASFCTPALGACLDAALPDRIPTRQTSSALRRMSMPAFLEAPSKQHLGVVSNSIGGGLYAGTSGPRKEDLQEIINRMGRCKITRIIQDGGDADHLSDK